MSALQLESFVQALHFYGCGGSWQPSIVEDKFQYEEKNTPMRWVLFQRGTRTFHRNARPHWHGTTLSSAFRIMEDGFRVGHGKHLKKTGWFGVSSYPDVGPEMDSYSRHLALERASIHRCTEWKKGVYNAWAVPVVINVGLEYVYKLDNFKRFPKHYKQVVRGDFDTCFTWPADIDVPLGLWIPLERYERFQSLNEKILHLRGHRPPMQIYRYRKEGRLIQLEINVWSHMRDT